jgi:hypothetical protein
MRFPVRSELTASRYKGLVDRPLGNAMAAAGARSNGVRATPLGAPRALSRSPAN